MLLVGSCLGWQVWIVDCFMGLTSGYGIALPPVLRFGSKKLREKMRDVVDGKKVICLNVTEPYVLDCLENVDDRLDQMSQGSAQLPS